MNRNASTAQRNMRPMLLLTLVFGMLCLIASAIGYNDMTAAEYAAMNDGYMKMSAEWFAVFFLGVCGAWVALCVFMLRYFGAIDIRLEKKEVVPLFVFVLAALVLRVMLSLCTMGYESDVACFKAWGFRIYHNGPIGFYADEYFCDYPPGYLYLLLIPQWFCEKLHLTLTSSASTMFYKLPAMLSDVLIAGLLYRRTQAKYGHLNALFCACMILFSPALWVDSAIWGQVESVLMLFLLLCFEALEKDRIAAGCLLYACAVLVKPQALMFGPVLLVYAIHYFIRKREKGILPAVIGALAGAVFFAAAVIPFCIGNDAGLLVEKYFGTMTSYPYITLNALNIYQFFGLNVQMLEQVFLGLSYSVWTWLGAACCVALSGYVYWKYRNDRPLLLSSAFLMYGLYMFGPSMHERYLFPVVVLLVALAWQRGKRKYAWLACAVSAVQFAAMAGVLRTMHFPKGYPLASIFSCLNLLCFAVFAVDVLREKIAQRVQETSVRPLRSLRDLFFGAFGRVRGYVIRVAEHPQEPRRLHWDRWDTLLVAGLTIAYAFVGMTNLGDTVWPQTWWEPQCWGENYVYDMGSVKDVSYMQVCEGIGDGSFQFECSLDAQHWTQLGDRWETSYADFFSWKRIDDRPFTGRYVRISVMRVGGRIYEIGLFDAAGEQIPLSIEYMGREDAEPFSHTIDEQSLVPARPDYRNGAYFDEVYHARTAYEQLKGWPIYEQTHPPLGKDIMMLGIRLFGMTPFGWRFMGTLAGILMLPVLYVFGKYLFQKRGWAAMLTALMGLDFMHYAQTRIATIDSFSVLFILLMYLFMYIYLQQDFFADQQRRAFLPLALCGLFFGIGAATKWICIYAGAGLAVIFFGAFIVRSIRYRRAKWALQEDACACRPQEAQEEAQVDAQEEAAEKAPEDAPKQAQTQAETQQDVQGETQRVLSQEQRQTYERITRNFHRNHVRTIAFCMIFFVLIPCVIYCLSYLPYVGVQGQPEGLLRIVLQNQEYMYSYHSDYVLDMQGSPHPYQSMWYTWPFIGRPIFFFMGEYLPYGLTAGISSFGNPAIWWFGVFAVGFALACLFKKDDDALPIMGKKEHDTTRLFIILGLLAQFVPWLFVTRSTYIYHYFATTPFLMMCIVSFFRDVYESRRPKRTSWAWAVGYMAICLALFVFFYPLLTGIPVSRTYAQLCRWLPGWVLYGYWL